LQPFAAILIASPTAPAVDPALIARASDTLPDPRVRVLAPGVAAELLFAGDAALARRDLVAALGDAPVDVAVLPAEGRRKRLLIADMDSTMIGQECIDELAGALGLKRQVAAITERAMRGEIDFAPALRERVALLRDLPASTIETVLREKISATPGARELVATMRANSGYAALVSGGFTAFTGPVAASLGFNEHRANTLELADGLLTGAVSEPILGREAKRAALEALIARLALDRTETLAVGDGANDLDMLQGAGLGVAFRAKPAVAEAADVRIDHGDLTALLYLQGYAADEIVRGA
jgi:phosphoserine phosphatase